MRAEFSRSFAWMQRFHGPVHISGRADVMRGPPITAAVRRFQEVVPAELVVKSRSCSVTFGRRHWLKERKSASRPTSIFLANLTVSTTAHGRTAGAAPQPLFAVTF